jgi:hypothetical protein
MIQHLTRRKKKVQKKHLTNSKLIHNQSCQQTRNLRALPEPEVKVLELAPPGRREAQGFPLRSGSKNAPLALSTVHQKP